MGGISVLIIMFFFMIIACIFFALALIGIGLFIAATVISIVFAVGNRRREEEGKKLGAKVCIPIVFYITSIAIFFLFALVLIVTVQ